MASSLLKLTNINRFYQSGDTVIRALDNVSLEINHGEFVAIMGQSGSGKSTLMNILGCLDKPTSGSYQVMGREASTLVSDELASLRNKTFGFIFQRYNLLSTATAEENVEIPAIYAGLDKDHRIERAKELLGQLGLGERTDHRPSQLSGGQQQRVAVARALMNNPPVILADEPTGALDSKSGEEVMALLHKLHGEGRTIILITHDEKVAANAKRIIHISDGRIISDECYVMSDKKDKKSTHHTLHITHHTVLLTEITEAAKLAMRSLKVNLFRTALTLLGIIIGVASVVTMLAVGAGSKQEILDQITSMGTNLLSIRPGAPGLRGTGDIITLTPEDAEAILKIPNVEAVVPERNGRFSVRYGNIDYLTTIQGMGASLPLVREWPLAKGNFFSERDLKSYAPVAVLGQTVVTNLFPNGENPVGQYVLIKNIPFEVVGVMTVKGASSWGNDQDDVIFVPFTTGLIRLFGKAYISAITVKVADLVTMPQTEKAINDLLRERHRTEDFRIRNMAALLDTATATADTLTILLAAVAAISLLVGGIGVMNIMLVSVTERTREIGIRMATGARMRDILLQFNTESAVICVVGGILGVALGIVIGLIIKSFGVSVIFSVMPALLAFSCAFITGLVFGYLPAKKAARLDPVVALASE